MSFSAHAWKAVHVRRCSTVAEFMASDLTPLAVFGSLSTMAELSERRMVMLALSRSTSAHVSASNSPRRQPVASMMRTAMSPLMPLSLERLARLL
jgi:hypothetical protein